MKPKNVTVTLTLTEAAAVYQYLRWAKEIEYRGGAAACWAKLAGCDEYQRVPSCVVDRCERIRPPAGGVTSTAARRGLGKLHHALCGDPVAIPLPDEVGETWVYPNALVNLRELERL